MSAKPTDGPFGADGFNVYSDSKMGVTVAYCGQSTVVGVAGSYRISEDEARANAVLFAAAAELLDAARMAAGNFERCAASPENFMGDDDHETWFALNAAIAKAEGRASIEIDRSVNDHR